VPLSNWCWSEEQGAFPPARLEGVRRRARAGGERSGRRGRRGRRGGRGGRRGGRPAGEGWPDPSGLFDELAERALLPALVFSFSRKDCERLARRNEDRELLDDAERARAEALQEELVELFQLQRGVLRGQDFGMARRGVGYHHAGMLPVFKEVVERFFTAGLIKLLFTTETFALGINMPARAVVFNALRKFDGVSVDWIRVREFLQMAGRAGRQGIDEKGFVYCVLGQRDLREAPLERYFAGKPEPVVSRFRLSYSTLLHLVERAGREPLFDAWERSCHRWQSRAKNAKARERQRRDQRRLLERHLALLDERGYLEGDELTARGRIARCLSGYELQATELLFQGTLENLPARALAVVFVGLVYEERGRERPWVPARLWGGLRKEAGAVVGEVAALEARLGIDPGLKRPDWGLTAAVEAWFGGAPIEDLEQVTDATAGDVCRVFRLAIQLMRNVRRAIDPAWDLGDRLEDAVAAMNRDEVDARRQLELG
jgi:superfamily II RNA helicase